ncbi:histidinol dehydrogenase [Candidatus Vidania fulgoroideorum]
MFNISINKIKNIILKKKNIIKKKVLKIYSNIKKKGEKYLKYCIEKYDGIKYKYFLNNIKGKINNNEKKIIKKLYKRVYKFHKIQYNKNRIKNWSFKDKNFKVICQRINSLKNIMIYVPGGKYCYLSTLIMNIVPAIISGVKNIYLATPSKGKCFEKICYISKKLKIKKLYRMGGAHAIFSSALGIGKVKKVDKIIGPGNDYVNESKKIVYGITGIDTLAGPTELLIIFGKKKIRNREIFNIYSQLEHGKNSKVFILLNLNRQKKKLNKILNLNKKLVNFKNIFIILCNGLKESIKLSNLIAPEHLMVYLKKIKKLIKKINNFGTIFIGKKSIETTGDYFAGSNHVLPTSQNSKFSSPLSINDFLKSQNIIKVNKKKINNISFFSYNFSKIEGLKYHSLSAINMINK